MSALLSTAAVGQSDSVSTEKRVPIVGRVLANVATLGFGAGLGPQYQTFIFGMESKNAQGDQVVKPVEIVYAFFKDEGPLRDSFFDHSKRYELNVVRDSRCDQPLSKLSYEKNTDTSGKELPPTNVLQILYGTPRDVLKSDAILPCYILHGLRYKVISQDADRITSCQIRVPRELQDATFTIVYKFDTKDGRPVNITRVKNDFLQDDEFAACISRWKVPSMAKGVATFAWNAVQGWTMNVSAASTDGMDPKTGNLRLAIPLVQRGGQTIEPGAPPIPLSLSSLDRGVPHPLRRARPLFLALGAKGGFTICFDF
jgi:hypothetical protein